MCQRIRHDHDPLFNHARHYVGPVAGSVRASVRAFAADLPQRKPALLRDARWPEPHLRLQAAAALAPIPHEADLKEEIAFFKLHDTNDDGFHTKKEFYYAVMEDAFEPLVNKYNKFAVDMEFEIADTDGDKKVRITSHSSPLLSARS